MDNPTHDPKVYRILEALKGLEYGSLLITIHDSKMVQLERTEKHRFVTERKQENDNRHR
ncbi:YezD family protein [Desmospora activa]|uniref:DUF2292 domain-containing protein n=1 Tax=Desmospora activa DSM 45169 TaxID=1121389 RepID=A0A2T4ZAU5_9BACL|nr:YezD family protein [Desmospora activa]PTM59014.1 hypothetical protein C8J48_1614 [Desmospora activa DSM 45169]